MTMDCADARQHLVGLSHGRLDASLEADVQGHLRTCAQCAAIAESEAALTAALGRLPQHPASSALKERLRAAWPETRSRRPWSRRLRVVATALAVAAAAVVLVPLAWDLVAVRPDRESAERLVAEAVNDHVRMLIRQQPLEVRSGGIHQVRPWFTGRLDFAPVVPFGGDEEFPLQGGAVGYFIDRRAAVLVYGHGRHTISLLVFRAEGLRWPRRGLVSVGAVEAYADATRGFNVLLWRRGDLGYALVSDVEPAALRALAARLAPAS
jgi:anti-sigma factor RsiW